MTITNNPAEVICGTARFLGTLAAFATRVDQIEETITLHADGYALPTVVVGGTGTGKTVLLESLAAGAREADFDVTLADVWRPDGRTAVAASLALAHKRGDEMAEKGLRAGEASYQPHMLLVDDMQGLDRNSASMLQELSQVAGKTDINLVVATQSLNVMDGFAGAAVLRANLTTGNVVRLSSDGLRVPGAGVSSEDGAPFRVWYPGA